MSIGKPNHKSAPAGKSLKDSNRASLVLVMLGNMAAFYIIVKSDSVLIGGLIELVKGWYAALPAGAAFIFTSVGNELLSSEAKARLVFLRWRDPMPGAAAFTMYAKLDPRIDVAALKQKFGPLPKSPRDQNALWYRLYKTVENEPAVFQAHRNYLFTRDYAAASFMFLVILGAAGLWEIPSLTTALLYVALLIAQYLAVRHAAKNHGIRFVTTVLAIKAAE
jgi:hypothetical protein